MIIAASMTLWQEKHETLPLDDMRVSKYSILPSSTFSGVVGLSAGAGATSATAARDWPPSRGCSSECSQQADACAEPRTIDLLVAHSVKHVNLLSCGSAHEPNCKLRLQPPECSHFSSMEGVMWISRNPAQTTFPHRIGAGNSGGQKSGVRANQQVILSCCIWLTRASFSVASGPFTPYGRESMKKPLAVVSAGPRQSGRHSADSVPLAGIASPATSSPRH